MSRVKSRLYNIGLILLFNIFYKALIECKVLLLRSVSNSCITFIYPAPQLPNFNKHVLHMPSIPFS